MLKNLRQALRDPFYRSEVRSFWTWKRYVVVGAIAVAVQLVPFIPDVWVNLSKPIDEFAARRDVPLLQDVYWRFFISKDSRAAFLVLSVAAALFTATCITTERVSGSLEQAVLTSMAPERYVIARLMVRIRGLLVLVLPFVVGERVIWSYPFGVDTLPRLADDGFMILNVMAAILTSAAVGMRFSCTSRSTTEAAIKTLVVAVVLIPLALEWLVVPLIQWITPRIGPLPNGSVAVLVLQLAILYLALRSMKHAAERVFFQPEEVETERLSCPPTTGLGGR